ncbi:hypothetical protein EBU95_21590 [bacterium]|nr:hypothetical protein [bacterium]
MSFLGGLIVGSMLSNNRSYHGQYSVRYRSWEEIWPNLLIFTISSFIIFYIVAILVKRSMLKETLKYGKPLLPIYWFTLNNLQTANEYQIIKIKDAIKTLQEKPKFFLSPLWIAKFTLRTQINAELVKLQNELIELKAN